MKRLLFALLVLAAPLQAHAQAPYTVGTCQQAGGSMGATDPNNPYLVCGTIDPNASGSLSTQPNTNNPSTPLVVFIPGTVAATCTPTIPGTTIGVGAGCIARSSFPTLTNPVDPRNYGADPTGTNNSAAAFQAAVNAGGDMHVTCPSSAPCTYKISDASTRFPVYINRNMNVQCDANVTLYDPDHDSTYTGMFWFDGGTAPSGSTVTGGGVQGCTLLGANSGSAPLPMDSNQFDYLIVAQEASNLLFEGNTFSNTWADAALFFGTNSSVGVTQSKVQYNTFNQNPIYGFAAVAGGYDTFQNNLLVDSVAGVEANNYPNNAQSMSGHFLFTNNLVKFVNGGCVSLNNNSCGSTWGVGITGGTAVDGFTGSSYPYYGTNTVSNNYVTGAGSGPNHAYIYNFWNSYVSQPPTYTNNILGPGATCWSGAGAC